jgi:hypothetical protein
MLIDMDKEENSSLAAVAAVLHRTAPRHAAPHRAAPHHTCSHVLKTPHRTAPQPMRFYGFLWVPRRNLCDSMGFYGFL